MKNFQSLSAVAASTLLACALNAHAHDGAPVPANVVQLSASGQVEVAQDMLTMRLSTRREATDANTVQNQLKVALEQALAVARPQARAVAMEVRTGGFGLNPRYGRDGQINGWQGTAELFLEGKSDEQIAQLSKVPPLERLGRPEDIAGAVSFLLGADGGWINGQVLRANGGFA